MSEILKEAKPSSEAINAFLKALDDHESSTSALLEVYPIDVTPLIARVAEVESDNARLSADAERLAAEVERLTKERRTVAKVAASNFVEGKAAEHSLFAARQTIAELQKALLSVREFVADEVENRDCAGGEATDYVNDAKRALEIIDGAIELAQVDAPPAIPVDPLLSAAADALDAAESILRYTPQISTNCNGTKPGMTTPRAYKMVCDALAKIGAPTTDGDRAPRPVTDDEVRSAIGRYQHDSDAGASFRAMRAVLEQFAKERADG